MNQLFTILILSVFFQTNAQKFNSDGLYIPKDLNDSFIELDKMLSVKFRDSVKIIPEDDFTADQHFRLGIWMRNNWGLWKGSRLKKYFNKKGISHPDDMSGVILHCYHRYLNKKDLELDKQIKIYMDYWIEAKKYSPPEVKYFPEPNLKFNGGIVYGTYTENRKKAILYFIENGEQNSYYIWDYYFGWKKITKELRDSMEKWLPQETESLLIELFK